VTTLTVFKGSVEYASPVRIIGKPYYGRAAMIVVIVAARHSLSFGGGWKD